MTQHLKTDWFLTESQTKLGCLVWRQQLAYRDNICCGKLSQCVVVPATLVNIIWYDQISRLTGYMLGCSAQDVTITGFKAEIWSLAFQEQCNWQHRQAMLYFIKQQGPWCDINRMWESNFYHFYLVPLAQGHPSVWPVPCFSEIQTDIWYSHWSIFCLLIKHEWG